MVVVLPWPSPAGVIRITFTFFSKVVMRWLVKRWVFNESRRGWYLAAVHTRAWVMLSRGGRGLSFDQRQWPSRRFRSDSSTLLLKNDLAWGSTTERKTKEGVNFCTRPRAESEDTG